MEYRFAGNRIEGSNPSASAERRRGAPIPRTLDEDRLEAARARAPVVLLTGPRQAGKSTLARKVVRPARTDRPQLSPSIRNALRDLELDRVIVVHASEHRFDLAEDVIAIPARQALAGGHS